MTKQIRGGNSAFASKTENFTESASGCYRSILLRSLGLELQPTPEDQTRQDITFNLGFCNEKIIADRLVKKKWKIECDVAVQKQITENVSFTGHIDIVGIQREETTVFELKSVSSTNTYVKVFEKKEPKLDNIAQLCSYLMTSEHNNGLLLYTNFIYAPAIKGKWDKIKPGFQAFNVTLEEDIIVINGKESKFKPKNILTHMLESARVVETEEVSFIKPTDSGACFFCGFKDDCFRLDTGEINSKEWKKLTALKCRKIER